ncbi:MAG: 16S rRNA (guanine(527)-N(7))-methyltransferase RsmG [Clostridia bacterium]|nr:16S rRNA (guanine(527)-N(7))-methyltransferase RsmG [Clostridia bacterium]
MSNFTRMMLERAAAAGIPLNAVQAEMFETYHRMLIEANARFNLTRVPDDEAEAIDRNYLDCIAPLAVGLPEAHASLIDVGSGAGFPGIPLAICLPETRIVLMDSLGKRVEFLQTVIDALGLNAQAVHLRAEDGARKSEYREAFDLATARAVAPLNLLCEYLLPFVKVGGRMLALKGPGLDEEVAAAENALSILGGRFLRSDALPIPGRDWDHRAAWIEKVAPTPDKYPRKAGKPEKKPL